jgi:hypothetical protein
MVSVKLALVAVHWVGVVMPVDRRSFVRSNVISRTDNASQEPATALRASLDLIAAMSCVRMIAGVTVSATEALANAARGGSDPNATANWTLPSPATPAAVTAAGA